MGEELGLHRSRCALASQPHFAHVVVHRHAERAAGPAGVEPEIGDADRSGARFARRRRQRCGRLTKPRLQLSDGRRVEFLLGDLTGRDLTGAGFALPRISLAVGHTSGNLEDQEIRQDAHDESGGEADRPVQRGDFTGWTGGYPAWPGCCCGTGPLCP